MALSSPAATLAHDPSPAAALAQAADLAVLAPPVHDPQPWRWLVHPDRLVLRTHPSRRPTATNPTGRAPMHRALAQSLGAALFTARVALAARGWNVHVERLPAADDPDLVAVIRPVPGAPDAALAALAPAVARRDTDCRHLSDEPVPEVVLRGVAAAAATEDTVLVPVRGNEHRTLVSRLSEQAARVQAAAAHRAGSTPRRDASAETRSPVDQTTVLLATDADDALAWMRSGEAVQRVLLELRMLGWSARPLPPVVEVPLTRTQLRSALTWNSHPQMLLRIGRAEPTAPTHRRRRSRAHVAATTAA